LKHDAPFGFHQVPEFQLNVRIDWLHIVIQTVQEWDAGRYGHTLDIFVADIINVFDQGADRIGVADNQTLFARLETGSNDGLEKGEDAIGRIL
jgi:hypothetical protein